MKARTDPTPFLPLNTKIGGQPKTCRPSKTNYLTKEHA